MWVIKSAVSTLIAYFVCFIIPSDILPQRLLKTLRGMHVSWLDLLSSISLISVL